MPISDLNKGHEFALLQLRKSILDDLNNGKIKLILAFLNEGKSEKVKEYQLELKDKLCSAYMKELGCEKADALESADHYWPEAMKLLLAKNELPISEESISEILGIPHENQLVKAKSFLRKRKGKSFGK